MTRARGVTVGWPVLAGSAMGADGRRPTSRQQSCGAMVEQRKPVPGGRPEEAAAGGVNGRKAAVTGLSQRVAQKRCVRAAETFEKERVRREIGNGIFSPTIISGSRRIAKSRRFRGRCPLGRLKLLLVSGRSEPIASARATGRAGRSAKDGSTTRRRCRAAFGDADAGPTRPPRRRFQGGLVATARFRRCRHMMTLAVDNLVNCMEGQERGRRISPRCRTAAPTAPSPVQAVVVCRFAPGGARCVRALRAFLRRVRPRWSRGVRAASPPPRNRPGRRRASR